MNKEQVTQVLRSVDVSRFPLREKHILLTARDNAVRASLREPGDFEEDPQGFHPHGYFDVALDFATTSRQEVLGAAEAAIVGSLRHELHEHMRSEGKIVFNAHPEVPGYVEKLNANPLP